MRPGRGGRALRERHLRARLVEGAIVGGTEAIVSASSTAIRALQNGLLRYYAALLTLGVGAVGLYFLVRA